MPSRNWNASTRSPYNPIKAATPAAALVKNHEYISDPATPKEVRSRSVAEYICILHDESATRISRTCGQQRNGFEGSKLPNNGCKWTADLKEM
jgi:hypothetical protein